MLNKNGHLIIIEEYPFIINNVNKNKQLANKLKKIVKPKTPCEVKTVLKENNFTLIKTTITKINNNHKLYGFIFKKGL